MSQEEDGEAEEVVECAQYIEVIERLDPLVVYSSSNGMLSIRGSDLTECHSEEVNQHPNFVGFDSLVAPGTSKSINSSPNILVPLSCIPCLVGPSQELNSQSTSSDC